MFRVSAVLRRYDADVPPTAVGADFGSRPFEKSINDHHLKSNPRTPHTPLSARIALERVVIANSQMVATQSQALSDSTISISKCPNY